MVAIRESSSQIWKFLTSVPLNLRAVKNRWCDERRRSLRESCRLRRCVWRQAGGRVAAQRASPGSQLINKWGMVEKEKGKKSQEENKESGCQAELKGNRVPRVCGWKHETHTQRSHMKTQPFRCCSTHTHTHSDKHTQTVDCSQPSLWGQQEYFCLHSAIDTEIKIDGIDFFLYLNKDLCGCTETNHKFTLSECNQGLPRRLGLMMWNTSQI